MIVGDRLKKDVIRADRADGFYLRNMWIEQGAFNDVDVVETNGFKLRQLVTPYGAELRRAHLRLRPRALRAHRGVRQRRLRHLPGLGPRGPLQALRHRDPQRELAPQRARLLGHGGQRHVHAQLEVPPQQRRHLRRLVRVRPSGHAAGLLEVGHQRGLLEQRRTTSPTTATRTARTRRSRSARETIVCPQFQVPVGSGFILYGVNDNLDLEQQHLRQLALGRAPVLGAGGIRGENDPAKQFDTSNGNKFIRNQLGYDDGRRQPNGTDFFWDENGIGNCWAGNFAPGSQGHQRPAARCRRARRARCCSSGNTAKLAAEAPCATWDPRRRRRTRPAAPGSRPRRGRRQ